ncbi:NAD(P)-dependent alcohol dehydrogenase [Streptomyces sp. OE57]|uniref:NAD(P)-dependent alcohol dehydrogenase n=1 Tax=Streptomyces lacaronensis TaxID=3379885 RepID=UPI0039B78C53
MAVTSKAALAVPGEEGFRIADIVVDEPREHEVLVRVVAVGLCHTDTLYKQVWEEPSLPPLVLGHEGAGVVERVGSQVTSVKPGDRVLMTFDSCGQCVSCLTGHPAYCARFGDLNTGPALGRTTGGAPRLSTLDGKPLVGGFFGQSSLAGHALANDRNVIPVEADSDDELALLAPLGCGFQTGAGAVLNQLPPAPGATVAIFGTGAVGFGALLAARLTAAARIVVVDIVPGRLALARELGATHTVNSAETGPVQALGDITSGGVQVAVDTTGVPEVQAQAVQSLAPRGRLGLIGLRLGAHFSVPITSLLPGVSVQGVIEGDSDIVTFLPALVELVRQGRLPLEKLVREYPLDEIDRAISDSSSGSVVKPVIRL